MDDETPLTTGAQAQGALALKQYWMLHVWLAAGLGLLFVASYPFINESFERMTFTYGWAFNIARTDVRKAAFYRNFLFILISFYLV